MIQIESPRLSFRELTMDDYDDVAAVLLDEETNKVMCSSLSAEYVKQWLQRNIQRYESPGYSFWHVRLKDTHQFVGIMGIVPATISGIAYIGAGYLVHPEFQRQGYAYEGMTACIDWAFRELATDQVVAEIAQSNTASICLAEKLGMSLVREHTRGTGENDVPHVLYSISRCIPDYAE